MALRTREHLFIYLLNLLPVGTKYSKHIYIYITISNCTPEFENMKRHSLEYLYEEPMVFNNHILSPKVSTKLMLYAPFKIFSNFFMEIL